MFQSICRWDTSLDLFHDNLAIEGVRNNDVNWESAKSWPPKNVLIKATNYNWSMDALKFVVSILFDTFGRKLCIKIYQTTSSKIQTQRNEKTLSNTNLNFSFWIFEFLQNKNDLIWIFRVLTFENEFGLEFLTFWKKKSDILIF